MRLIEWLLMAISDIDIWERNTRPRRRDDDLVAEYRAIQRRAGYAILATTGALMIAMTWAALGPPAGDPPHRGLTLIIHWVDRGLIGLVLGCALLAALRGYQAWRFIPERAPRRRED